jgi:hypothetical protein
MPTPKPRSNGCSNAQSSDGTVCRVHSSIQVRVFVIGIERNASETTSSQRLDQTGLEAGSILSDGIDLSEGTLE